MMANEIFQPTAEEAKALAELAAAFDMSEGAVLRQALRLYQRDYYRRLAGETCTWTGDAARAKEFLGPLITSDDDHGY